MPALTAFLSLIITLSGIVIAILGFKKNIYYKGAFFFFLFNALSGIYTILLSIFANYFVRNMMVARANNIGIFVRLMQVPGFALSSIGVIILIVTLAMGLKDKKPTGQTAQTGDGSVSDSN